MTVKYVINEKYSGKSGYIRGVPDSFESEGTVLYDARNVIKAYDVDGKKLVVKRFRMPHIINRVAYTLFRKPKARRAYEHAFTLLNYGIPTPAPIAYIIVNKGGLIAESYYIYEYCEYKHLMRDFGKGDEQGRERVLNAFTDMVIKCHMAGIYNMDLSPGNVLYDTVNDEVKLSLVDVNRIQFGVSIGMDKALGNFARMDFTEPILRYVVKRYAASRGWNGDCYAIASKAVDDYHAIGIRKNKYKKLMKRK